MSFSFRSIDPSTDALLAERPAMTSAQVEGALVGVQSAFSAWSSLPLGERCAGLRRLADLFDARSEELSRLATAEMGKPMAQARAEVAKCATSCRVLAEHAAEWLADEIVPTDATRSFVTRQPLGVVLGIMPWNFPFWQVVRFAVPALLAGNTVLLKHAPGTMGCALALESLFARADLGRSPVFRSLLVDHETCAGLIADARVAAVSLTGSTRAGREVAALAGRALKKCVLELGGSDPCIILEDADLDVAVPACVTARMLNAGQSCIAGKRFIVVDPVRREFSERFIERLRSMRCGDPRSEDVDYGPLARRDLRDALHEQVLRSVAAGARLVLGGEVPRGPGAFYPATVLDDVAPGMPAADEELFGPVAALLPARDQVHALELARATSYGLGAAVFTRDVRSGVEIARELPAGSCFVNDFVRSDARLPFGGVGSSGFGRELGRLGMLEFVNQKTIYVR